jgi:hypothetical protein
LGLGVVPALGSEHDVRVGAGGDEGSAYPVVLRDVAVVADRRAVEKPQRPAAHSGASGIGRAGRRSDPLLERSRVEILIEEIYRLHDVHVAIHEPVAVFHLVLLFALVSNSAAARHAQPDCSKRDLEFNRDPLGFARVADA